MKLIRLGMFLGMVGLKPKSQIHKFKFVAKNLPNVHQIYLVIKPQNILEFK